MVEKNQTTEEPINAEDTLTTLADQEIIDISEALQAQDSDTVHSALDELSPVDTAELLEKLDEENRSELVNMYGDSFDAAVFTEIDPELSRSLLSEMPAKQVSAIVSELESDDALYLIENLDEDFQQEIMRKLSSKIRRALEEGLAFPEDSAGRLMQREVVAIPQFWSVGKTIDYLRDQCNTLPEEFFDIFIINPNYHVTGQLPLSRLIRASRDTKISTLTIDETHPIPATMDQESVAHIFRRDNLTSAPVIDEDGRLIGAITIDDVVDVIDDEAEEDILKMAGVDQGDLYRAALATTSTRFRWLFINLLTAILASIVISFFDATIEQLVALAVLMPIVASMGGNAGTQALTVAVRALATRELSEANTWRVIWKETLVGSLNGVLFAVITATVATLWFKSLILGAVIAMAMVINMIVAGFFGASIPVYLSKRGSDPAVSSTVFLTTLTDVIGFFAFLGLAAMFLL